MIDYGYEELFEQDSIHKDLSITYEGGSISNTELKSEDFELQENLCSQNELVFGCCESSYVQFSLGYGAEQLKGKNLSITTTPQGGTPLSLGRFKVVSDEPTADRRWRDIVAYDKMHDILNTDLADWYNELFENTSEMTLKIFRDSLFTELGISQVSNVLANDGMIVEKTVNPKVFTGKDILLPLCEINGCFGRITRDGQFEYVYLQSPTQGLFPDTILYPQVSGLYPTPNGNAQEVGKNGNYKNAIYGDYTTDLITKLQIREKENDIGVIVGDGDNMYVIENNFLVYGKSTEELTVIANNIFNKIKGVYFCPATIEASGNPCLQPGDGIKLVTKYATIETYILQRTLKGIQALQDTYISQGSKARDDAQKNNLNKELIQLKGKSNELERTIEQTQSTITDVEAGLQTQITQNANSITAEVTRAGGAESTIATALDNEILRATTQEGQLDSRITQTASEIRTEVSGQYATIVSVDAQIQGLQDQIDNRTTLWSVDTVPTLNNYPANEWTTDALKDQHINDIALVSSSDPAHAGENYRFEKKNGVYAWNIVQDTVATQALARANEALAGVSDINDNLTNYALIDDVNTELKQTSDTIAATVSESFTKYDLEDYTVSAYGFGAPDNTTYPPASYTNQYYLDNTSGDLYLSNGSAWAVADTLDSITAELQSQITANSTAITTKVSNGEISSKLSQEAGQITISANRLVIDSTGFKLDANGKAQFISSDATNRFVINDVRDQTSNYVIRVQKYKDWSEEGEEPQEESWEDSFNVDKDGAVTCKKINCNNLYVSRYRPEGSSYLYGGLVSCYTLRVTEIRATSSRVDFQNSTRFNNSVEFASSIEEVTFAGRARFSNSLATVTFNSSVDFYGSISIKTSAYQFDCRCSAKFSSTVSFSSGSTVTFSGNTTNFNTSVKFNGSSNSVTFDGNVTFSKAPTFSVAPTFSSGLKVSALNNTSGNTLIKANNTYGVTIGSSTSYSNPLGFFGSTGNSKQTVNKLSSSATLAQTVTKVNDLLTALKNYGLITSS